jgi:hypothetical protein
MGKFKDASEALVACTCHSNVWTPPLLVFVAVNLVESSFLISSQS